MRGFSGPAYTPKMQKNQMIQNSIVSIIIMRLVVLFRED